VTRLVLAAVAAAPAMDPPPKVLGADDRAAAALDRAARAGPYACRLGARGAREHELGRHAGGRAALQPSAATQKVFFRIVGAAGISAARDATWATQDRCDGTRTDVGKGRVTVLDTAQEKTITVRAGRSHLAKARLFAAKRG
jgi:hypothetical protein